MHTLRIPPEGATKAAILQALEGEAVHSTALGWVRIRAGQVFGPRCVPIRVSKAQAENLLYDHLDAVFARSTVPWVLCNG